MAVVGIVPAAGRGERLGAGSPKAFVVCAGRPLIEWSLAVLEEVCDRVIVAVPPGFETGPSRVTGGVTRSASVRAALAAAPEASIAVVQDAARPMLTASLVEQCIDRIGAGWDGAIAAARVTDTVKQASADGRIEQTLDRSLLWSIQTPQVFRADVLRSALEVPDDVLARATDDSWLVEAAGGEVCVVEAPPENIKVTRGIDLEFAEAMLRHRVGA